MKDIGFEEFIPKLAEHDIADPEIFFGLSDDDIISNFDIKIEGKKYRFKRKMKELKEKHEKKLAEIEEEKMRWRNGESFELLKKRSTLVF